MNRNRLLYAFIFFMSLSFIYFYGGKVPYMFFYTVLIMPLVSLAYTFVIYMRFKYSQDVDKRFVEKGDNVNFIFNITNEDPLLFPYMRIAFCGAETIFSEQFQQTSFSIPPYGKKSFYFNLNCNYRGNYEIGLKSIELVDFLGIFKLTYKIFGPKSITVYPRIVYLDRFELKTDYQSESHSILNSRHEDMSTILDVRQYQYGDTLKKVHWKLTAKSGELMVKKFQSTTETSSIVMLDLKKGMFTEDINTIIEDKLIESAVSIIYYCLHNWIPIKFVYYDEGLVTFEASNPLEFEEIYNALAKMRFYQDIEFKDILDVYLKDFINKTNIILFTPNLNYSLYDQIHKTCSSGFDVSLIYVSDEEATGAVKQETDKIIDYLPEIGVSAYKINISDDIKSVLERK